LLGQRMRFTGQRRDRGRGFTEPSTGVGARHRSGVVSGECLPHGETGMTFHGSDESVTQDVSGYRRALGPREGRAGPDRTRCCSAGA
jgi:hypothetical protein